MTSVRIDQIVGNQSQGHLTAPRVTVFVDQFHYYSLD